MLFAGTATAIASRGEFNCFCLCTRHKLGAAYIVMNERGTHASMLAHDTHRTQARVLLHHGCSFVGGVKLPSDGGGAGYPA
jgi:hypothetical protein